MRDNGGSQRVAILRGDVERKILAPLRLHGWQASILREVEWETHLVADASRGGQRRRFAVMYSGWSSNGVYRQLASEVDVFFLNGALQGHERYTVGVDKPILDANAFQLTLVEWNRESCEGKFAPEARVSEQQAVPQGSAAEDDELVSATSRPRVILSETPIDAVWLRLRQLHSVRLAARMIGGRRSRAATAVPSATAEKGKAEGVAFALRNASDYFQASQSRNLSQRVLNLYYGTMAFAFAEMLADPSGPSTLADIENSTKRGHGLYTLDGPSEDAQDIVVGVLRSGFFPSWMAMLGKEVAAYPREKAKAFDSLPQAILWSSVEGLFARIPEVADLFLDIFDSPSLWLYPAHDMDANLGFSTMGVRVSRTYGIFTDVSGRLTKEDVAEFPVPISEITEVASAGPQRKFRAGVDHEGLRVWWDALNIHVSPLGPTAIIKPIFGHVGEYRALCFVLLYALSIVVRYRPSLWRRVQEGDHDHLRVLIEAFLAVCERILPQHFLQSVTGDRVYARQQGMFG